jgi:4-amino-4-deoxy-L-arabinose transferase-like glycosyltransferase
LRSERLQHQLAHIHESMARRVLVMALGNDAAAVGPSIVAFSLRRRHDAFLGTYMSRSFLMTAVLDGRPSRPGDLLMPASAVIRSEPDARNEARVKIATIGRWVLVVNLAAIAVGSLWFRLVHLDQLPGINGDEAWYGVQVLHVLAGEPFAYRTPSGLPLNPFFAGLEIPFLLVFSPAFWILRAPAVISGVLAALAAYMVGSKVFDRTTGLVACLLLATLPSAIGYSRFGWDASQTPLFSVLALYFALRGKGLWLLLAFLGCLVVHASNVFLFPVLLAPFLVDLWGKEVHPEKRRLIVIMTATVFLLPLLTLVVVTPASQRLALLARTAPSNWLNYLQDFAGLITGVTMLDFVVGPLAAEVRTLCALLFWGLVLVLLASGLPGLLRKRQWDRVAVIVGLALATLGLYVVGGPEVIRPHRERYGMCLYAPTIQVAAILFSSAITAADDHRRRWLRFGCMGLVVAGCWGFLLAFKMSYLDTLSATGGDSHLTFRTASVEPKQQALRIILDDISRPELDLPQGGASSGVNIISERRRDDQTVSTVVAENWWLYQPIRFLAGRNPEIAVMPFEDLASRSPSTTDARKQSLATISRGGYAVGFADGELEQAITSRFPPDRLRRWDVVDSASRTVILVYRVRSW